jgi:hypothetical protein
VNAAVARTAPGLLARFDELLGRPVSMRSLTLLRVLAGPAVLWSLWPFLSDALDGRIYSDSFYEPYASWYPELPRAVYVGLLFVAAAAAVAMTLGILSRLATITAFTIFAYNLFLSTTHFHNNRAYLLIVLGILSLVPSGRDVGPGWPLWLLRFECAAIYGASGLSKLLDPDWFGGAVTWGRVVQSRADLQAWHVPDWLISLLTNRDFHTGAAKLIVLTELSIAVGLWSRRTRYAALWVAVVFHLSIEASASVQVFSYLGIAVLLIWAVPSTRDRVLRVDTSVASGRRLVAVVRRLDWLQRFRIEPAGPGSPVEVVDRDGTALAGRPAVALAFSRLPLTAWFALPVAWLARR